MSSTSRNQLSINRVHFSYEGGEEILKGISLELDHRPTAIIGQNGAGKTTFVKLLKGLLIPTKGCILWNGEDITKYSVAMLAKEIGLVFQNPNDQIFKNTVIDEVMFGPLQIGMTKVEAEKLATDALEMVDLLEEKETNPYDLGLSERKLISIASVIAMNTKVIIFDEPTIAQDYRGKELIKKLILRLREEGKMVISILHDMDFVAETFERVIVFASGQVLLDGTGKEIFGKKSMLEDVSLEQPHITRLGNELGCEEIFLNVEDFVTYKKL
ncbi:MAG: ABC transporter ATP-binding protein [Eubacteriales bacterium]